MKVLILGAGQVGETLAQRMVSESSDVTLVDSDRQRLDQVVEHLDVSHLIGNAASPELLKNAGIENTELSLQMRISAARATPSAPPMQ